MDKQWNLSKNIPYLGHLSAKDKSKSIDKQQ